MNKRHYEHTLPNIRGSLSNTYKYFSFIFFIVLYFNGIAMSFREIQSNWHAVSPIS